MSKEQVFLNPKLTLSDLALRVGTNRTYLSNYINQVLHQTFFDYINSLRLTYACRHTDARRPYSKRNTADSENCRSAVENNPKARRPPPAASVFFPLKRKKCADKFCSLITLHYFCAQFTEGTNHQPFLKYH